MTETVYETLNEISRIWRACMAWNPDPEWRRFAVSIVARMALAIEPVALDTETTGLALDD